MTSVAHHLYCYEPQRRAIVEFFSGMGLDPGAALVHGVSDKHATELHGLRNVNFVVIKNHPNTVPFSMWAKLETIGAVVVSIDHSSYSVPTPQIQRGGDVGGLSDREQYRPRDIKSVPLNPEPHVELYLDGGHPPTNRRACGFCADRYPLHDGEHILPGGTLHRCLAL